MKTKAQVAELMEDILYDIIPDRIHQTLQLLRQEVGFLREAGQREYAGGDSNALGNFERLASMLELSREQVLWVYCTKHLDGITAHIRGHKSQREDVRGRINDAIVYLILLRAIIDDSTIENQPSIRPD